LSYQLRGEIDKGEFATQPGEKRNIELTRTDDTSLYIRF
jgi:hypothetical protein